MKHRLMKVVQIQNNYQKHRQRLMSIQHINSSKKPHVSAFEPTKASQNYKRSKLKADIFMYEQQYQKRKRQNQILLKNLDKYMNSKSNLKQSKTNLGKSPSARSLRSSISSNRLSRQNNQFFERINNTKSTYSKIRLERVQKDKSNSKERLINLLVNQLGVKPSVLFPSLSKDKVKQSKSSIKLEEKTKTLNNPRKARNKLSNPFS